MSRYRRGAKGAVLDFAKQPSIHVTAPARRSSLCSIACAAAMMTVKGSEQQQPEAMSERCKVATASVIHWRCEEMVVRAISEARCD